MMKLNLFTRNKQLWYDYADQQTSQGHFYCFYKLCYRLRPAVTRRLVLAAAADVMRPIENATLGAVDKKANWERLPTQEIKKKSVPDFWRPNTASNQCEKLTQNKSRFTLYSNGHAVAFVVILIFGCRIASVSEHQTLWAAYRYDFCCELLPKRKSAKRVSSCFFR